MNGISKAHLLSLDVGQVVERVSVCRAELEGRVVALLCLGHLRTHTTVRGHIFNNTFIQTPSIKSLTRVLPLQWGKLPVLSP